MKIFLFFSFSPFSCQKAVDSDVVASCHLLLATLARIRRTRAVRISPSPHSLASPSLSLSLSAVRPKILTLALTVADALLNHGRTIDLEDRRPCLLASPRSPLCSGGSSPCWDDLKTENGRDAPNASRRRRARFHRRRASSGHAILSNSLRVRSSFDCPTSPCRFHPLP